MRPLETLIELTLVDILQAHKAILAIKLIKTDEVLNDDGVAAYIHEGARFHEARLNASHERLPILLEQSSRSVQDWRADHSS